MEVNQEHLKNAISDLEKGYVDSLISLIKVPVFNKRIRDDLKTEKDKNKIKELNNVFETNQMQEKAHKESIENLEEIITEAKKLLK